MSSTSSSPRFPQALRAQRRQDVTKALVPTLEVASHESTPHEQMHLPTPVVADVRTQDLHAALPASLGQTPSLYLPPPRWHVRTAPVSPTGSLDASRPLPNICDLHDLLDHFNSIISAFQSVPSSVLKSIAVSSRARRIIHFHSTMHVFFFLL